MNGRKLHMVRRSELDRLIRLLRETDYVVVGPGVREEAPRYAFFGVRACELAAMAVLDRVTASDLVDPYYRSARERAFKVAVNCTEPGAPVFALPWGPARGS